MWTFFYSSNFLDWFNKQILKSLLMITLETLGKCRFTRTFSVSLLVLTFIKQIIFDCLECALSVV